MIKIRKKFTIPEYKSKKEIYELLGYQEISYIESGFNCKVTFCIDESAKHYLELRKLEKQIYRKGPPFFPILLLISGAFVLLSFFVIFLAISIKDQTYFDLNANAVGFLLPAFSCIAASALYTYFYFSINKKIDAKGKPTREEIIDTINSIKSK